MLIILPFLLSFYFLACLVLGIGESCPGNVDATISIAHASFTLLLLSPALNSTLNLFFVTPYRRAVGKLLARFHCRTGKKHQFPLHVIAQSIRNGSQSMEYGRVRVVPQREMSSLPARTISADANDK